MSAEKLMIDAIDLHAHCGPDEWRSDALEMAQQAKEAGMKVVLKSHKFGTAPLAWIANRAVKSPVLIGSLALDSGTGGLNLDVVRAQVGAGAKVIWMPTTSAAAHIKVWAKGTKLNGLVSGGNDQGEGISIIDKDGKLVPQIVSILDIMRSNKVVLATGHVSIPEIFAVTGEALRQHINVIITHPFARPFGPSLPMEQALELASMGAYIEFCFVACMPPMRMSPESMADHIKKIGAGHCILSTDFGQPFNPTPTEGFRMMMDYMLRFGLSENELTTIVKANTSRLLGLT